MEIYGKFVRVLFFNAFCIRGWTSVSGAFLCARPSLLTSLFSNFSYFEDILERNAGKTSVATDEIEKDLNR